MRAALVAVLSFFALACSSGDLLSRADLANYQNASTTLSAALVTYCSGAGAMQSMADCTGGLQAYLGAAGPAVATMMPIAGHMDGEMEMMNRAADGDARCSMQLMTDELARLSASACASSDLATDRAAAAQHCGLMQGMVDQMQMRGAEAGALMGMSGSGMMSGGMGSGIGSGSSGSWTMPDGGVLPWSHAMPGCVFADGGYSESDGGNLMDGGH
jgi:hypothetical protein